MQLCVLLHLLTNFRGMFFQLIEYCTSLGTVFNCPDDYCLYGLIPNSIILSPLSSLYHDVSSLHQNCFLCHENCRSNHSRHMSPSVLNMSNENLYNRARQLSTQPAKCSICDWLSTFCHSIPFYENFWRSITCRVHIFIKNSNLHTANEWSHGPYMYTVYKSQYGK